ncbi:uncharacterized protein LOC127805656 [Diospyros lotus]|uniref:uncharacterized protein LOC127805656 n=1 Tax=Diospyros lotus TaxID=55363 RepID=UPI0022527A4B|nr:uncharacterized protein LOC127805656 [Diospyros lotus]
MGSLYELLGFVGTILRESSKLLAKHGKSMLTITATSILLNCLLLFANLFSTKPAIKDFVAKTTLLITNPGSFDMFRLINDMQQDVLIIVGTELAFFLATLAVLLFSIAAMIQASALFYSGKSLSSMDFVSRLARSFVRPFATFFYFSHFYLGYIVISLAIRMLLAILLFGHNSILLLSTIILLPTLILWIYLSVVWILAVVISVIKEGCYGMEALGKAQKLAKGKQLQGFALSCVFVILPMIVAGL